MKKIFQFTFVLLGTCLLYSQITLNTIVTEQNKVVTDPSSIRLLSGFGVKSSNVGTFRAYISSDSGGGINPVDPDSTGVSSNENYILTTQCLDANCVKKIEVVQYFDLLGRPKQVINVKATPLGRDIVTPVVYDELGRQTRDYLPIPQASTSNGGIYPQTAGLSTYPLSDASGIYNGDKIFTERILEKSPIERVLQQKQVGSAWDNKPITLEYDLNNASDRVKRYDAIATWNSTLKVYTNRIESRAEYQPGKLIKNSVTDEDGNTTIEFKDGSGQTILIRKAINGTEKADTYYVYNEYKQLAFVIPPLASTLTTIDGTTINNLCYRYIYDSKNRLVEKKLPGKGWEQIVYNKADRQVLAKDANLTEKKQWVFTKYDKFGRVAYTGIINNAASRQTMQNGVDLNNNLYETRSTTAFTLSGMPVYYSALAAPLSDIAQILSVNYYDSYPPQSPAVTNVFSQDFLTDNPANKYTTKGLPTASYVKNIEDDSWTRNFIWYDTKGRLIGSRSNNHLGGYTVLNHQLDFSGAVLRTSTYHRRLAADTEKTIHEYFTYDHQNRLLMHRHKVGANPIEILAQNKYNELSQLESKKVGGISAASPIQQVDYKYNIRGWLTHINDPAVLGNDLFGYKINYNQVEGLETPDASDAGLKVKPRYNGSIAEVSWKTLTGQNEPLRRYGYVYDSLNRLTAGFYQKAGNESGREYFEKIEYDLNGNISQLRRSQGRLAGSTTSEMIDNLKYDYTGNILTKVTEQQIGNSKGYPYLATPNLIEYDPNGNMISHKDKNINKIIYNLLNLPVNINMVQSGSLGTPGEGNLIDYKYRADGLKVEKSISYVNPSSTEITNINYLDGFQYERKYSKVNTSQNEVDSGYLLRFIPTREGYYNFENNKYIYNHRDHLGNVRLSYTKNSSGAEIIEENNYYPFGLRHEGYNTGLVGNLSYQYKYNGKELQETGMLDYGWRQYMPDLGKWNGMDQLAEKYSSTSPFAYVSNNPISFIDPDGRWMDAAGNIDKSGQANPFTSIGQRYKPAYATSFMGVVPAEGGEGGNYLAFGRTEAYSDLMTAFKNGGTGGLFNDNGIMRWWTDFGYENQGYLGTFNMLKLAGTSNPFNGIDISKTFSNASWWANTAVGAASTANIPRSGFLQYNELWHQTKTKGVSYAWQNKWKNPGAKYWRGQQVKGFQGARNLGSKLTKAGGVLLVADIAMSGELKPSHGINAAMLGISGTGVGSIVAGVWFITDMGTGAFNYLNGEGFKTLSDVIDNNVGTYEMYEGVY